MTIRFASFLGDNAREFYQAVVAYLGQTTGLDTELVTDLSSDEKEAQVEREEIQIVFTCGLPYVGKADKMPPRLRLLAAPVLAAERYQNQPVYFSDVIVRADSPHFTLADLAGATFAYNEIHSFSGYISVWGHLLRLGLGVHFFGEWRPSGTHADSMDAVAQGRVAAAAIDSVVLEMELWQRPERANTFRVIERIGPYPMPPVAAVAGLAAAPFQQVRQALLGMHETEPGRAILHSQQFRGFTTVSDQDYDPIRQVVRELDLAGLPPRATGGASA